MHSISAAVIFLLRVSATLMYWNSRNDLSRVNVIAAVLVSFVYLVFLALTCKPARHTMSQTHRYLIDIAFLAGSVTVIIRLLGYSPWATNFVYLGTAEAMVLSNTGIFAVVNFGGLAIIALPMTSLYLMICRRDWGVAAVLGLCTLFPILKHENGWLECKSICGFGWLLLKGLFGVLMKKLKSVYDFLDNKEMKDLLKSWADDEVFREADLIRANRDALHEVLPEANPDVSDFFVRMAHIRRQLGLPTTLSHRQVHGCVDGRLAARYNREARYKSDCDFLDNKDKGFLLVRDDLLPMMNASIMGQLPTTLSRRQQAGCSAGKYFLILKGLDEIPPGTDLLDRLYSTLERRPQKKTFG